MTKRRNTAWHSTHERPGRALARSRYGRRDRIAARVTLAVFLLSGAAGPAGADPTETALGPAETTYGSGSFTLNDATQTEFTQQSPQAILDWGLDIQQPAGHTLGFRQQDGFSVLNRSPGVRASNFYGTVTCDATCIFANEAGVYFQDGSFVDVGLMIAAGGTITNADFLAGQYAFDNLLGDVVNHGLMRGDSITLLGQHVANFGQVETPGGSFAMLAGDRIVLRDHDSPIVIETLLPPAGSNGSGTPFGDDPAVLNAGTIDATGGDVRLAAGDMLSFAIRNTGEIRARNIALEGGDEGLVEVGGRLDASDATAGATGGTIEVLGDYVSLVGGAVLDASGSAGGGTIHVGGERQGGGESRTARGTYVHPDAQIHADALAAGDGGEVIVWADDTAQIYGEITARGGLLAGDGGFVETSGKRFLDVRRGPSVGARSGRVEDRGGEWLIDPNNIAIVASSAVCGSAPQCLDNGLSDESIQNPTFIGTGPVLRPTVNDSMIAAPVIANVLQQGVNVTILTQTVAEVQGDQVGNISVLAPIVVEEEQAPGPGTTATLALLASQNITVDAEIGVKRRAGTEGSAAPSDIILNIFMLSADQNQAQAPAPEDQIPNNFLGAIAINRFLKTEGGGVNLQGFGVTVGPQGGIETNGGTLDVQSIVGDIELRGVVDTSTTLVSDVNGEPLSGGRITMRSEVVRRPTSGVPGSPTIPVGGDINVLADMKSGGGDIDLTAEGGNLVVAAAIESTKGGISLRALEQTLAPVTSADTQEVVGGDIVVRSTGLLSSGGGFIDIGVADLVTFLPGARTITIHGGPRPDPNDPAQTLDAVSTAGGPVLFNTVGTTAAVRILGDATGPASIVTEGGRFESFGEGTFLIDGGEIDTRGTTSPDTRPSDFVSDASIRIQHDEGVTIRSGSATNLSQLAAETQLVILSGQGSGVGDLILDPTDPVSLIADDMVLIAGDGEATGGAGTQARVDLGATVLEGFPSSVANPDPSPSTFTLQQDADLQTDAIIATLRPHLAAPGRTTPALERVTLSAWDGFIEITEADLLQSVGLDLDLNAGLGVKVPVTPPTTPVTPALDSLDISIVQSFVLDSTLAAWIDNVANVLTIGAGAGDNLNLPSLTVGDGVNPLSLRAGESLTLQAGQRGIGDLAFAGDVRLGAPEVTLRAGNGDVGGISKVRTAGLANALFDDGSTADHATSGRLTGFTIRQDASIDGSAVLASVQFAEGLAGVDYTLRADAAGSGISLDAPAASRLFDTDLRLFANGPIDLGAVADGGLQIRSLEIGGISDFQFTQALYDTIAFTGTAPLDTLVLRAALGGESGVLSFQGGLVIEADDIRLVAGDGVGGGGTGTRPGGSIDLTPFDGGARPVFRQDATTGPSVFVFQQDAQILQGALPDLLTNFAGNAPDRLAIRSDDNSILLTNFVTAPLFEARSQVVLSAIAIELERTDGSDLVIEDLYGDGTGGLPTSIEQRADIITWSATDSTGVTSNDAEVIPGSRIRLSAFDTPPADSGFSSPPPPFDFAASSASAPDSILLTQDGSIDADNLIGMSQLGNGVLPVNPNFYRLTSNFGSITIQPGDVQNPALITDTAASKTDLALILAGTTAPAQPRSVYFVDFSGSGFFVQSLRVENPFEWRVQNAVRDQSLLIDAVDTLDLLGSLADRGNLTFGQVSSPNLPIPGVTLRSRAIALQAGDDPSNPLRESESPSNPLPVVDTGNLDLDLVDRSGNDLDTILQIIQLGGFTDAANPPPGFSHIIDSARIHNSLDPPGRPPVDQMQLTSILSDIVIDQFGDGVSLLPATSVSLVAGSGLSTGGRIRLAQIGGGDLNLSVDALGQEIFEDLTIFARTIELEAVPIDLTDATPTVIRAEGTNVFFLGPVLSLDDAGNLVASSPESISFDQNGIVRDVDGDCTNGCLPDPFQLGPSLSERIFYSIRSRRDQVVVNDDMSVKVWGSNLSLEGSAPGSAYDVDFALETTRDLDLFVSSLVVGRAQGGSSRILLRSGPGDAFGDLTIVSALTQSYLGTVEIDGVVELTGNIVDFASTIDAAAGATASDLVIDVVSEGIFAGDIGVGGRLDRFRVNFNPNSSPFGVVRFGSAAGGEDTFVNADSIQFLAVSDLAAPDSTIAARSPTTSTIYKRGGHLTFDADTFQMGEGERLSVQGDLAIHVRTAATVGDLSALDVYVGDPLGGSPTIALQLRQPGNYITLDGALMSDSGLGFVANTIDFAGGVVLVGNGRNPIFGIAEPRAAPAFMSPYSVLAAQQSGLPLTSGSFDWSIANALPDLHPEGASRDDITQMFIPASIVPTPPAWEADGWMPWERSELTNLFVFARPLDPHELQSQLAGAGVIDDVGRDLQAWDGRPLPVAGERLDGKEAKLAVDLFEQIFGADGGNVDYLRRILQRALDEYTRNTGARRVVGFELRRYVKNRPSSLYQAYQLLEDLDRLFAYHRGLGLTPGEYRPIQARWLAAIRPDGITTRELAEAVQPSRYVRGSDVLDIFGD